jgi:hypothetical protein
MMCRMAGRDTKTRYQGVFARHQKYCVITEKKPCNCKPGYYGVAWDRTRQRPVKTKHLKTADAARNARFDMIKQLAQGEAAVSESFRLREARERFVRAARDGRALNKRGQPYKRTAIDNIEECLRVHVEATLGARRISDIRRSQVQAIVDELAPRMSGSRVRAIVNSLRSLYRWAQDRELVAHDPAALVRLPAMNATPIELVASPAEFAQLLDALALEVAVPYALALALSPRPACSGPLEAGRMPAAARRLWAPLAGLGVVDQLGVGRVGGRRRAPVRDRRPGRGCASDGG